MALQMREFRIVVDDRSKVHPDSEGLVRFNPNNDQFFIVVSCFGFGSGKEETSRSPPPLRTERATFTALGSSLDKAPLSTR